MIEGIALQGLGNWQEIAKHVGTRTKEEVEEHYRNVYINSPNWPLPVRLFESPLFMPHVNLHVLYRGWTYRSTWTLQHFTSGNEDEYLL